jgi:hypothetical protein
VFRKVRYLTRRSQFGVFVSSALLVTMLMSGTPAQAKWGPKNNCGIRSTPNEHCYAVSKRPTGVYASIAAEDNENAHVYDWGNGGFIDNEQWVSFYNQGVEGWIEDGITIGNDRDCCTAYPFIAEDTPKIKGGYYEYIAPGPVASGSGEYNYDLIFDAEHNGVYRVYWSTATNTWNWTEVTRFSGWPVWISEEEGGMEAASEDAPLHAGRQEVAASNGGEWWPWGGATWYHSPGVCIGSNRELPAAGNIEWTPGHNEC